MVPHPFVLIYNTPTIYKVMSYHTYRRKYIFSGVTATILHNVEELTVIDDFNTPRTLKEELL